jgi:hypothetical protein
VQNLTTFNCFMYILLMRRCVGVFNVVSERVVRTTVAVWPSVAAVTFGSGAACGAVVISSQALGGVAALSPVGWLACGSVAVLFAVRAGSIGYWGAKVDVQRNFIRPMNDVRAAVGLPKITVS